MTRDEIIEAVAAFDGVYTEIENRRGFAATIHHAGQRHEHSCWFLDGEPDYARAMGRRNCRTHLLEKFIGIVTPPKLLKLTNIHRRLDRCEEVSP